MVKDLVCGRYIDYGDAAVKCEHRGKNYYFCSVGCKEDFEKEPKKYINQDGNQSANTPRP